MFAIVLVQKKWQLTKEAKEFLTDPAFEHAWEYIRERDNAWEIVGEENIISKHYKLENAIKHFRKRGNAIKELKTGKYLGTEVF